MKVRENVSWCYQAKIKWNVKAARDDPAELAKKTPFSIQTE